MLLYASKSLPELCKNDPEVNAELNQPQNQSY